MAPNSHPNPHLHSSKEGAGMAPRRSPLLHPHIQAIEKRVGATRRRSPRLHPEIHASHDGAGVTRRRRRRRGTLQAASASLPDEDDMLREILLRLPPQPSSVPRAAAVCKRWRGLVSDPLFRRQFHAHHRKPPLLGVFERTHEGIIFKPMLDPPDRIPPERFNIGGPCSSRQGYDLLDCRHGLVLIKDTARTEVLVCDPITREQHRLAIPPEFNTRLLNGAVLCAAGDQGHVHGGCHSGPFKVVLMTTYRDANRPIVCVYSSKTGIWGNLISTDAPYHLAIITATLVGNALYWLSRRDGILEFDLDGQTLAVISGLPVSNDMLCLSHRIIRAGDGALGFAALSFPNFRMWRRHVDGHGAATWVPWKTIEIHTVLGLPSQIEVGWKFLVGYGEDNHVVFLLLGYSVYMVELESMQSRKLYEAKCITRFHPFTSFYTPGTAIVGGSNGPEMLHNT